MATLYLACFSNTADLVSKWAWSDKAVTLTNTVLFYNTIRYYIIFIDYSTSQMIKYNNKRL